MYVSTGAARSTPAAASSPTNLANTSRSVRTPTRRSSASVTNTKSPSRSAGSRAGNRRSTSPAGRSPAPAGRPPTGAPTPGWGDTPATARSVSSVTGPVYAYGPERAVDGIGCEPRVTLGLRYPRERGSDPRDRHRPRRHQRHRVRLRRPVREARLRDRRRLADARSPGASPSAAGWRGSCWRSTRRRGGRCAGCHRGRSWGRSAWACATSPTRPPTTRGSRRCRSGSPR